jgi:hypothetical protein
LNSNTTEEFSFFAIEIELWRIGTSVPAPKFNLIASPNDWAKSTRSAACQVTEVALAERHHIRISYWASFSEFLKAKGSNFKIRRLNKDHWFEFPIGRAGFAISATISIDKKRIGVELYNHNDPTKVGFRSLLKDKDQLKKSSVKR